MRSFVLSLVIVSSALLAACEYRMGDEHGSYRDRDDGDHPYDPSSSGGGSATAVCGRPGQACTSPGPLPNECATKIDRWKELLVVNRSVLMDRRARNDIAGAPWSFRTRLEELAGSATAASALASAWFEQWKTVTSVGVDLAPVTPRPKVDDVLLTPWRSLGGYGATELPLASAPFRLIAIVNRIDLRSDALACSGGAGELRFVYAVTNPTTKAALAMTVIVEIPYPATRTPQEWAKAWHALGEVPFGDAYNEKLATLTSAVTKDAKPDTWLVRTNEIAFGGDALKLPWEMREFALENGRLTQQALTATPRIELNRSPSLIAWAKENKKAVVDGSYVLPSAFQAGAAPIQNSWFTWDMPGLESTTQKALSLGTCNGCHGGATSENSLRFQHISAPDTPGSYYGTNDGETRVSEWLSSSGSSKSDELGKRETSLERALCKPCAAPTPATPDADGGSGYTP